MAENCKKIELWEGYEVEVNEQLIDDFEFAKDFNEAIREEDLSMLITMLFALVGGDKIYEATKDHIIETVGYFSMKELKKILDKIQAVFPKAGNRASRRSKWSMT